jgi:hypothetical protein
MQTTETSNDVPTTAILKDDAASSSQQPPKTKFYMKLPFRRRNSNTPPTHIKPRTKSINVLSNAYDTQQKAKLLSKIPIPMRFQDQLLNSSGDVQYSRETAAVRNARLLELRSGYSGKSHDITTTRSARIPAPSLFLQETAHLFSLLNAVALSTLRNDIAIAAWSPVTPYIPGVPWPDADPDNLPQETKEQYGDGSVFWRWFYFCLGLSRSGKRRTMYNATRPFGVLGGVSDGEIQALQHARGPYAKVALVNMWLQEFVSRETIAGSTGEVPGPMLSRIYQFISDGVAGYNQGKQ